MADETYRDRNRLPHPLLRPESRRTTYTTMTSGMPESVNGELTVRRAGEEQTFPVERTLTLGSRLDADLVIDHADVSPVHLVVTPLPSGTLLVVLDSLGRIPVLLNGEPTRRVRRLAHRDRVQLGDVTIEFREAVTAASFRPLNQARAEGVPAPFERALLSLERLADLASAMSSEGGLLDRALDHACTVIDGATTAAMFAPDGAVRLLGVHGESSEEERAGFACEPIRQAAASAVTHVDHRGCPELYVPVWVGASLNGILCVRRASGAAPFGPAEVRWIQTFGRLLASALDRVRLVKACRATELAFGKLQRRSNAMFDAISDGLVIVSHDGSVEVLNQQGTALLAVLLDLGDTELPRRLPPGNPLEPLLVGEGPVVQDVVSAGDLVIDVTVSPADALGASIVLLRDVTAERARETAAQEAEDLVRLRILEAEERERRRIGRDLHDGLCQVLAGTGFLARRVETQLVEGVVPAPADLSEISRLVADAIEQARSLARGLCPVPVGEGGLAAALQELATRTERVFATRCEFRVTGRPWATGAVADQLLAIASEAVSNAVKHGHASTISIELEELTNGGTRLVIDDDGPGFTSGIPPAEGVLGEGLGLRTMTYRARSIGGSLRFVRSPLGGVRVVCALDPPLEHV